MLQLIVSINNTAKNRDSKDTLAVSQDFKKAFDIVDQAVIIDKLKAYKVSRWLTIVYYPTVQLD